MDDSEFDKFAEEYRQLHAPNIKLSGESPEYFAEYKVRDLSKVCWKTWGRMPKRLLDFGAGVGTSIPYFQKHLSGTDVVCLDVSRKSLDIGRQRFGSQAEFAHFDGVTIPFPDASFDVFFAACVFHHIPHSEHDGLLSEAARILRGGGMALIYEHNPWNPLTVHTVNTCPFDENAKLINGPAAVKRLQLAGFSSIELSYRIYFPRALRVLRPLERFLMRLPLGAQYYVVGRK